MLSFIAPCYADDVTYLAKDTKAPYEGFLFTIDKTQEARKAYIERDYYKLTNTSLMETLNLNQDIYKNLREQNSMYSDQNNKLAQQARENQSMNNLERLAWTGVGAAVVIFIVYAFKASINK